VKFFRKIRYISRAAYQSIRNAPLLHAVSAGTIATAFVIFGGSLILFMNLRLVLVDSDAGAHISVYLKERKSAQAEREIKRNFCKKPFVKACEMVSAEMAKTRFMARNPELEETVSSLQASPFPPSVEISIDPEFKERRVLTNFVKRLEVVEGVESVDDGGDWADRWITLLSLMDWAMWTLGGLLGLGMLFVVANTIKLIVYARRDEIEILSLVGATSGYIRTPFLLEGLVQGVVGAGTALGVLKLLFLYSERHMTVEWGSLWSTAIVFLPSTMQWGMLLMGGCLGVLGSLFAVGRFIKL